MGVSLNKEATRRQHPVHAGVEAYHLVKDGATVKFCGVRVGGFSFWR